jgi:hypothetical protein
MDQSAASARHTGSCLCGAVRIIATGAPETVIACHCASCRRHTGAPCAVFADYRADRVEFPAAQPMLYASSPGVQRGFCGVCGSTLSYQGANLSEMIHLHIGLFDRPEAFVPQANESMETALPWLHIATLSKAE